MDPTGAGVLIEQDSLYLSLGGRAEYFNTEKYVLSCHFFPYLYFNVFPFLLDSEECAFLPDAIIFLPYLVVLEQFEFKILL